MKSRRQALDSIEVSVLKNPHPGLWLDKFLPEQTRQGEVGQIKDQFKEAAELSIPDAYSQFFQTWKAALQRAGAKTRQARALGRLAIGLGAESVLENSLSIHRTYGVPYIPGSALKGLAARYARLRLEDEAWRTEVNQRGDIIRRGEAYRVLFGDTAEAGYVTFFDALYVPNSAPQNRPLVLDVITVHHPKYYQGESAPPADWDSPTPVPFLSARGSYLIALFGPDAWVDVAFQILARALREEGIGAKTNSGYGRMTIEGVALDEAAQTGPTTSPSDPDEPVIQRFRQRLDAMASKDVAGQIRNVYEEWRTLDAPKAVRKQIARMIVEKVEAVDLPKKWKKQAKKHPTKAKRNLAWYEQLRELIED